MKLKKFTALAAALLLILAMTVPAFGYQASESSILGKFRATTGSGITAEHYVIDMAGLLTKEETDTLYARAYDLSNRYECGVYILTIPDMYAFGYTFIESFSEDWYDTMGYGYGGGKNGVMLVLSMDDRDYDLDATGSFGNRAFTDYGKQVMADRFLDYFGDDDWYGGFCSYLDTTEKLLERGWNGDFFDVGDSLLTFSERLQSAFILSIIPSLLIGLITVFALRGRMNTAKAATKATGYVVPGSIVISGRSDRFTHRTTTRTPKNTGNRSGGGGGTSISAGGHSHHSGKF